MNSWKKIAVIALAFVMIFTFSACSNNQTPNTDTETPETPGTETPSDETSNKSDTFELALITDVGTIDDKSFNQGAWEGVEAYAKENNITYKYYKPAEKSDSAYINSIELAVKGGAKVVVCPGFLFEVPIYTVQTKYPDVNFIILDGAPHAGDNNIDIAPNTYAIFYAEEQAGFLAGYGIVKEGYTKLGFMGGIAVPPVERFGYGFVQGADYAAKELGLSDDIEIKYTYVGNFDASPENQAKASAWYNDGTEVIFGCGGAVGNSVMKAAETAGAKCIGVDVDQADESTTVVTSAMKNLSKSVYDALADYYAGNFPGGTSVSLDASREGVELPMETSRFENFTQDDYSAVYDKIIAKDIEILNDTKIKENFAEETGKPVEEATAANIPVEKVKVEVIK